jgi:ferric-dicitrate binding protein FerR (iron transport regulator)
MDDEHTLLEAEERLRAALRPDEAASNLVVKRALGDAAAPPRTPRRLRFVGALAVLAIALGISAWQWRRPGPVAPVAAPLVVTGRGPFVVVEHQDGRRWIVGPPPEPRAGGNYVIVVEK